jgi:hypothetical protein
MTEVVLGDINEDALRAAGSARLGEDGVVHGQRRAASTAVASAPGDRRKGAGGRGSRCLEACDRSGSCVDGRQAVSDRTLKTA